MSAAPATSILYPLRKQSKGKKEGRGGQGQVLRAAGSRVLGEFVGQLSEV